jgi:hypothetical protein
MIVGIASKLPDSCFDENSVAIVMGGVFLFKASLDIDSMACFLVACPSKAR